MPYMYHVGAVLYTSCWSVLRPAATIVSVQFVGWCELWFWQFVGFSV